MLKSVKYVSYYDLGGYFRASKNYMLALINKGVHLTWTPLEFGSYNDMHWRPFSGNSIGEPDLDRYLNTDIDYDTVVLHLPPKTYPWWIENEPDKKIVGYTTWETDKIKPFWVGLLNLVDQLVVPSEWNKRVFESGGVTTPIEVVPHVIDNKILNASTRAKKFPRQEYIFYSINTWSDRKNIPQMINAYLNAFTAQDQTCLVLKTTPMDLSGIIRPHILERFVFKSKYLVRQLMKRYKAPARIKLITQDISTSEIINLHNNGDCYVSLTAAEGWGLGAYDAASFGNPVIMTGFGGQVEFLPNKLAYLIDYDLVPAQYAYRGENFDPRQRWAEPNVEHASKLMRHTYENQILAAKKGAELRSYVREKFVEEEIIQKFINVLES